MDLCTLAVEVYGLRVEGNYHISAARRLSNKNCQPKSKAVVSYMCG